MRLFLLLFFVLILIVSFDARADITNTLIPDRDGTDDTAGWQTSSGVGCDSSECSSEVDEVSGTECSGSDGDLSYIESSIPGASQTFRLDVSSIPDGSTITQIDVGVCARRAQGGAQIQTRQCVNGSCTDFGGAISLGNSYTETIVPLSNLTITKSAATTIEVGITNSSNKRARVSKVDAVLFYTPPEEPPEPPSGGGTSVSSTGGGTGARLIELGGQAYPGASLELLQRNVVDYTFEPVPLESVFVSEDGLFVAEYLGLASGGYFVALRVLDRDGRDAGLRSFAINFTSSASSESSYIVEDILLPPTVGFVRTIVPVLEDVEIEGYAAPNSEVELEIGTVASTTLSADTSGYWTFSTSTARLGVGLHEVRARQVTNPDGLMSDFSFPRMFKVSKLANPQADFNEDGRVDVTDWSVFLSQWEAEDETIRSKSDFNGDGSVTIADLSIFLRSISI